MNWEGIRSLNMCVGPCTGAPQAAPPSQLPGLGASEGLACMNACECKRPSLRDYFCSSPNEKGETLANEIILQRSRASVHTRPRASMKGRVAVHVCLLCDSIW